MAAEFVPKPHFSLCHRVSMTVLIFIARAFIAGGFQAAYVYTPEVRHWAGFYWSNGDLLRFTMIMLKGAEHFFLMLHFLVLALKFSCKPHHLCASVIPKNGCFFLGCLPHMTRLISLTLWFYVWQLSNRFIWNCPWQSQMNLTLITCYRLYFYHNTGDMWKNNALGQYF